MREGRKEDRCVFREGRGNAERTPRVPSRSPLHTSPPSLHVGSFCMSASVIPGGQNAGSLPLSLPLSPVPPPPRLLYVCAVCTLIQVDLVLLDYGQHEKAELKEEFFKGLKQKKQQRKATEMTPLPPPSPEITCQLVGVAIIG